MARIIRLSDAIRKNEYEEFMRLLNSSIHCVERCEPEVFQYTRAIFDVARSDTNLEQGLQVLLQYFKVAVEENYKMKHRLRD